VDQLKDIVPTEQILHGGAPRGAPIPWWGKIAAKIVLSRALPSYRVRRAFGLFLHGNLDHNIEQHGDFVKDALAAHARYGSGKAGTILELGPGNTLGTALFAAARGVERTWLVDVGDFAIADMALYRDIAGRLEVEAPGFAARADLADRGRMLTSLNATYLTGGTASLAEIPSGSLDMILSTAVLEHVRRGEFPRLAAEMLRMLRPGGTAFHGIDLMDHLGGGLNNLRFSETLWESAFFANSGFYTNRLRCHEIVAILRAAGFDLALTRIVRWPALPTPRDALAAPFRDLPEDELLISNFRVLVRKPGG
jgi:SAM-dependent methyltransferase